MDPPNLSLPFSSSFQILPDSASMEWVGVYAPCGHFEANVLAESCCQNCGVQEEEHAAGNQVGFFCGCLGGTGVGEADEPEPGSTLGIPICTIKGLNSVEFLFV